MPIVCHLLKKIVKCSILMQLVNIIHKIGNIKWRTRIFFAVFLIFYDFFADFYP